MSVCSDHYWTIAALDDRAPLFLRCCPRGWATIMYVCLCVARDKFLRPITAQKKKVIPEDTTTQRLNATHIM